jgi:hypothetical protein
MPPPTDLERELESLAGDLRRLESEYTKFFAGRAPRPPLEARAHLDREFRKWGNRGLDGATARFRLQTLQSRYSSFVELWDRAMRAREEGRPSPLAARRASGEEPPRLDSEVFAAVMHDPAQQHDAMMEARKQTGHDVVPFERFAELVRGQVERLRATGASDVMFRVSVNEGRPNLTARPVKRKS